MNNVRERVETYCLARHAVSIPESFKMSPVATGIFKLEGSGASGPAFDIAVQASDITKSKFDLFVQKRRAELSESESETIKILKLDQTLPDGSVLFRVQEIGESYFSELYMLRGTSVVKIRLESFRNTYVEAEKRIFELSTNIRASSVNASLTSNEFCLGPVIISSKMSKEYASFMFRDDHGLTFGVEVDTYTPDEPVSLISRMSGADSLLSKFKVKHNVIRARERVVANMQAEEWLGVGYLGNGGDRRTLKFVLETKRRDPGREKPSLTLAFDSAQPLKDGTPTKTNISDAEATELWEQVVNSIRFLNE